MLSSIPIIARNAFIESIRQPIYLIVVLGVGIIQLFNVWSAAYSMAHSDTSEVSGDDKVMLDIGLSTVFVAGVLLSALTATSVISKEIEAKTVLTVVSKPVSRAAVVLGKYLGVSAALVIATICMVSFLLLGIRHGVMSTAADTLNVPVITLALTAVGIAVFVGAVCNFLYGWSFSQVTVVLLTPALVIAYIAALLFDEHWALQSIGKEFKPQIMMACTAMLMAILVLTAIAVAASTRLGQVMTIAACAGVFVFGLLSNHLIGRHAFLNQPVAKVALASPASPSEEAFTAPGDTYRLELDSPPTKPIAPGASIYYGDNPSGFRLAVPPFEPFTGDPADRAGSIGPSAPSAIIAVEGGTGAIIIRQVGGTPVPVARPPRTDDFLFLTTTRTNPVAAAIWSVVPNMHFFWLLDAITQNQKIPGSHLRLVALYSTTQIGVMLCLAVMLFQRRDVG